MKRIVFSIAIAAAVTISVQADTLAQCRGCNSAGQVDGAADTSKWPCTGDTQFTNGNTAVVCPKKGHGSYSNLPYRATLMARDKFSPHPVYAYSRGGMDAARIHEWNKFQSQNRPWHGGYNYWRWNAPTALVVPPTAGFQTSYAWGVGQTRSLPINHQFGTRNPGGGAGSQSFSSSPYMRSSTEQMGVYPVRAPWSHQ